MENVTINGFKVEEYSVSDALNFVATSELMISEMLSSINILERDILKLRKKILELRTNSTTLIDHNMDKIVEDRLLKSIVSPKTDTGEIVGNFLLEISLSNDNNNHYFSLTDMNEIKRIE